METHPMRLGVMALGCLLAACGPAESLTTPTPLPDPQAGIEVRCQPDLCPDGRVLVEIGDQAWLFQADSGVVLVPANSGVDVRVLSERDCRIFAEFQAEAGRRYVVSFTSSDFANVEPITGGIIAFPMGPGMVEAAPSGCEAR